MAGGLLRGNKIMGGTNAHIREGTNAHILRLPFEL